jgi:hypothetical protein
MVKKKRRKKEEKQEKKSIKHEKMNIIRIKSNKKG